MNMILKLIFKIIINGCCFKKKKDQFYEYIEKKIICIIFFIKMNYFNMKLDITIEIKDLQIV